MNRNRLLVAGLAIAMLVIGFIIGRATTNTNTKRSSDIVFESKVMYRDELRAALMGKTPDEVIQLLGKPERTQEPTHLGTMWTYSKKSKDRVNDKVDYTVSIWFERGVVTTVNF